MLYCSVKHLITLEVFYFARTHYLPAELTLFVLLNHLTTINPRRDTATPLIKQ